MAVIKGETSSGFSYEVNEKVRQNWLFVKAVARAENAPTDEGKVLALVDVVHLLMGDEGENRLCEHLMDEEGMVPSDRLISEVREILQQLGEQAKNS